VLRCILDGGGEPWPLVPLRSKKDAQLVPEHVYAIGPDRGHIGALLSLRRADATELARVLNERGEYQAFMARGGRVVVLGDPGLSEPDRALAFACVGAQSPSLTG
jgi:hypothetical protein